MSRRWLALRILYPILMLVGSFSKRKKETYQRFIISLNNKLVKKECPRVNKLLLLVPHCIQMNECDVRLTFNVYNCKRCGRCEIKDLIQIAEDNHITLSVATGGSLARRVVNDVKPEAVIAIACENELSSGIADIYPTPILGIPNERPNGPCLNTGVSLEKINEAINIFAKNSYR